MLDALKVAEDIIQQEHKPLHSDNIKRFKTEDPDSTVLPSIALLSTQKQVQDPPVEELYLPDSLDDFELPEPTGQELYTRDAGVSDTQKHVSPKSKLYLVNWTVFCGQYIFDNWYEQENYFEL